MKSGEFRKLIAEAVHLYPRARRWASIHNVWTDYGASRTYAQELRAMSRSLAVSDGILARDAHPLLYTAAVLRPPFGKMRHLHTLLHFASPEMDYFITERKSRSATGQIIHDYVDDANVLLSLGARGHSRVVCTSAEFTQDDAYMREMVIRTVANWHPTVKTTAARLRMDVLRSEFISAHTDWLAKHQ